MEVAEFRRLLHIGSGKIIPYLQNHDSTPYRDVILEACLNNTCYDPQVEGDRTPYLLEILHLTGEFEFYRDQILSAFAAMPPSNSWTMHQFYYFARCLAEYGDAQARQLLYDKCKESELAERGYGGETEIIDLDGVKGFLFILDPFDNKISFTADAWKYEYLLSILEHKHGKDELRHSLIQATKDKMRIQSFLNAVDVYRITRKLNAKKRRKDQGAYWSQPYETLKAEIIKNGGRSPLIGWWMWGERASEADLVKAAEDLLKEEHPRLLLSYLDIFRKRPFPLDFRKLIYLAQHDDTCVPYDRLAIFSLSALENITHPDVRALALKMIGEGNRVGRAVGLLQRNFQDDDWKLLASITAMELDRDDYHSLGFSISDIFDLHPSAEAADAFLHLYERCPCSQCRYRYVKVLHTLNALSPALLEECKFDANFDIRDLVTNGLSSDESS